MPRVDKTVFTQYATTGCHKQLRIALHPVGAVFGAERRAINLPHPQIRPQLNEIEAVGNEWGEAKVWDLDQAFGSAALKGGTPTRSGTPTAEGLRYPASELGALLDAGVSAGDFLIEAEFDAATNTFLDLHHLRTVELEGVSVPLSFTRVRPDITEVLAPSAGAAVVTAEGDVQFVAVGESRLILRVIDVKLTSEPGPRYFAELAYYSLALAAWLRDTGRDSHFLVGAGAGVWPGNEQDSPLQIAAATGGDLYAAFAEGLEIAPLRIFIAETLRVLHDIIPRVLSTPYEQLPWAVNPGCQGCENLGQKFQDEPGDRPSDWDPRHCIPTALATQDLSRLPFLSRGSMRVLRNLGHPDVLAVADLDPSDAVFEAHHRLRGQRGVVTARAHALSGDQVAPLHPSTASTAAIPAFAKLRLYLTADFDPGSAITLAFGLTWAWLDSTGQLSSVGRLRVHYTPNKTVDDEWDAFAAVLDDMTALLDEAVARDADASVQVYIWDELTFDHLTRVVSRHLARVLSDQRLKRLAWLFPPEEVVGNARLAASPAVSVVKDAVRSLLTLDVPHNYSLLETARRFHRDDHPNPSFMVPTFWSDPFSDQIPPERAHQVWRGRRAPNAPTPAQLTSSLQSTVRTKLAALSGVTDHLGNELRGRLPREAPKISQLGNPADLGASSHLGALLFAHSKLDFALRSLKVTRTRALPVEERESRFESARVLRELDAAESATVLTGMGLTGEPLRHVYELAPGSVDVKARDRSPGWVLAPEELSARLTWSIGRFLRDVGDQRLLNKWSASGSLYRTSLLEVLGASVVEVDRVARRLVVDYTGYGDQPALRADLVDAGHIDLTHELVLDPTAIDYFNRALEQTIRAIGNPPSAGRDPRMQHALGSTRNPRVTGPHPAEDFLWNPATTAAATTGRDTATLRQQLESRGRQLNDSQWAAWEAALARRLTLIWGPPGTGKTSTVQRIVESFADVAADTPLRVAVTASTYTAIDNVLRGLVAQLDGSAPHIAVRRLRSFGNGEQWLSAGQNVHTAQQSEMDDLVERLDGGEATFVAGTPQQLAKLLKAASSAAGPLFDVIVIDEAGAMDVANALIVIAGAAQDASLVVAGDPMQLPPIHQSEPPTGLDWAVGSIYEFFSAGHAIPPQELLVNYRSNAEIVELSRRAGYPAQLASEHPTRRIEYTSAGHDLVASGVLPVVWPKELGFSSVIPRLAAPDRPVTCLVYPEGISGQWNQFEAEVVVGVVCWYHATLGVNGARHSEEYFWTRALGVVTPHRAQRARIIAGLAALFAVPGSDPRTQQWIDGAVDTVERFQGQERDVIIASYAVGDPDTIAEEAEFLMNLNRFNVLSTRPRAKLVVIASRELVSYIGTNLDVIRSSELLKDFVDLYCGQTETVSLDWVDGATVSKVEGELRWA